MLEEEIESRNRQEATNRAKKALKHVNFTLAVEYDFDPNEDSECGPYYTLGIVKNGKFFDFYYQSGLEPEDWDAFIPEGWHSPMESTYECGDLSLKQGLKVLKDLGYTHFEDVTGKYDS